MDMFPEMSSRCAEWVAGGEREFAAFMIAITELFGQQHARAAAEDWLDAISVINCESPSIGGEWRLVTLVAASRVAGRAKADAVLHL
jgi:hypothetical protein